MAGQVPLCLAELLGLKTRATEGAIGEDENKERLHRLHRVLELIIAPSDTTSLWLQLQEAAGADLLHLNPWREALDRTISAFIELDVPRDKLKSELQRFVIHLEDEMQHMRAANARREEHPEAADAMPDVSVSLAVCHQLAQSLLALCDVPDKSRTGRFRGSGPPRTR